MQFFTVPHGLLIISVSIILLLDEPRAEQTKNDDATRVKRAMML